MLFFEELKRALAEVADLAYNSFDVLGVLAELGEDLRIRVRVRMEDVVFFLRILVLSEDEVDPMMQGFTYSIALQCCSKGQHQLICVFSPARQLNISNIRSTLFLAKLNISNILEKSREVVKLRNAFLDIRCIGLIRKTVPHLLNRVEQTISHVPITLLHLSIYIITSLRNELNGYNLTK